MLTASDIGYSIISCPYGPYALLLTEPFDLVIIKKALNKS